MRCIPEITRKVANYPPEWVAGLGRNLQYKNSNRKIPRIDLIAILASSRLAAVPIPFIPSEMAKPPGEEPFLVLSFTG